jgi:prepilin peptidase CpaA
MFATLDSTQVVVLALGLAASGWDLRTRHIPNLLTFGGALLGLLYGLYSHGPLGLLTGVEGWLVGVALFLPFFLLGGMGAGDVKLLGCFGAWLGPWMALWTALYAMIAGGAMAILVGFATGYLRQASINVVMLLSHWRVAGLKPVPSLTLQDSRGPRLPYALPLAVGAAAAIWFR